MARILVVDDDTAVRTFVQRALIYRGHEATTAADGRQALDALTAGLNCDLVISDIVMPDLDGIDLLGALAVRRPDLPVILMTAHTDQVRLSHAQPCELILKPFSLKEICAAADRHAKTETADCPAPPAT